jgi:hypothetical protein
MMHLACRCLARIVSALSETDQTAKIPLRLLFLACSTWPTFRCMQVGARTADDCGICKPAQSYEPPQ